jgi:hypothetical protein
MNENPSRLKRYGWTAGVLAAGVVAGGLISVALPAAASSVTSAVVAAVPSGAPGDGPDPVRSDEKALSGSDADKAKAAALKALPGATIIRVETDADGATCPCAFTSVRRSGRVARTLAR